MSDFAAARERMIERQIAGRGLRDPRLLEAFSAVPRELFVPRELEERAYDDCALPIECGQTISQPYIVALTVHAAEIGPDHRVLEVGAGSGYAAAVMSRLARAVIAVERIPALARLADERMRSLGFDNVLVLSRDGSLGCPGQAPFDAIVCAAAGPQVPQAWLEQLAPGGRIVMPVGAIEGVQQLVRVTLDRDRQPHREELEPVRFVPLIGAQAYDEPDPS
ncbi:MAG: Protein-L-isoaspartate O-methyltransferase [uncultured Sphingomonas sp.]|uniref:Protein-L-isoaspartate O-methyltransferase n=1 Tax=uncultured Sphingomonas sp. TaxID=158754 RepID=A0A6J4SPD7_9SPHN|nr:protein-L-isoaspartate(D-aspartate) O-methyltransferase [uncultured Sphingomonas sp.]CAA9500561.1 MAG: Protein-L-isoaspartate O-methyltransferase [uncultured Sphingomonas sp.]